MCEKGRNGFCLECRKETNYILQKSRIVKTIRDKDYTFSITEAVCSECGAKMNVPGLIDKNIREIDEQYRETEKIVQIRDIEKLMKVYNIGKNPLSLALGFGEITITRYLMGQIPSKEYSEVIRKALSSPSFMKYMLNKNKDKIAKTAYDKALNAASELDDLFSVSDEMRMVIAYLFERLNEVTPLMLQKLLYFVQGVSLALTGEPMFKETCQAWVHGPVFPKVYVMFRDFKYNPIDDDRFVLLEGETDRLTENEKRIVDLVIDTFGIYGSKTLENITHNEEPWIEARKGYSDEISSNEEISQDSIKSYFEQVNKKFSISTVRGLTGYIQSKLAKAG
ncbi:MAG: DUF4065 domain-containing protein [Erysipelotrichaceae bacterium]|nr:DUF4065 domain-containing protein [Erysipelotrichaceae bacterium]